MVKPRFYYNRIRPKCIPGPENVIISLIANAKFSKDVFYSQEL